MPFSKSVAKVAAFVLVTGLSHSAMAQDARPAPSAKPSTAPSGQPAVTAVPWTVVPGTDRPSVQISKTATDDATQFVGGCDRQVGPGLIGKFVNYAGVDLQAVDGQSERVLIEVRGAEWKEAFSAELRYNARSRTWELAKPLPPVFVGSFSRGAKLSVRNSQWQEVVTFDLTGSTKAAQSMRAVCGF